MFLQSPVGAAGSSARVRAPLLNIVGAGIALALLILMLGIPAVGVSKGKPGAPPPPPPAEPPARFWHAFTGNGSSDVGTSRLYLLGGTGDANYDYQTFADFWYYAVESRQWVLAPTGSTAPGGRQHAGLSCGAGECVTSNGVRVGRLKETWVYRERTGSWSQINCRKQLCPSARMMVSMAYDPNRFYHLLFGGLGGTYGRDSLDDTWSFAAGTWRLEKPLHRPPGRRSTAMAYVGAPVNGIVLFGGLEEFARMFNDMWVWDGNDWQSVEVVKASSPPPLLHSHSMAWDGSRLLVTGGYVDFDDTPNKAAWSFTFDSAQSGRWSQQTDPSGCYASVKPGAVMAYDRSQKLKVFFGGVENGPNGAIAYDDTVICE